MYYNQVQTRTKTTARPTIARAVVGFAVIATLMMFGVQWSKTSAPDQTSNIASGAKLAQTVSAVVVLYDHSLENQFLSRVKAHLLIESDVQVIAMMNDGEILAVNETNLGEFLTNASRPHSWFMSNTVGVVYFRDDRGQVRTSRISGSKTLVRIPGRNKIDPINSLIPGNAMYGANLECESECPSVIVNDVEVNIPDSFDGTSFFSLNINNRMESLFVFDDSKTPLADVEAFSYKILSRAQPKVIERTLDSGITIKELVPSDNIETKHYGEITQYGKYESGLFSLEIVEDDNSIRYLSSSYDAFDDSYSLSTLSWTNKVCGVKPSSFFAISFSSTFAENPYAPLYVALSEKGWRICER